MEKIKNLLNPGKSKDDETLYGSGIHTNTGGLTGEGSHLAASTGNSSGLAGSQTGKSGLGSTGTSNVGDTGSGITPGAQTQQSGHVSNTTGLGQSSGLPSQGSHLSSGTSSGLTSNQTPALSNTSTTAGSEPTPLAKEAATTAAITVPGNTGFPQHDNQHVSRGGLGSQTVAPAVHGQTGTGLGPSSTTGSHMPGSWDDSYEQGSSTAGSRGTNTTGGLGFSTGNPMNTNTSQGTSHLSSATGTSGLSQGQTPSHLNRDAAVLGTAGAVGEGIHHHRENDRGLGPNAGNTSSNSGIGSATVFPSTTSHSTQLGSSGTTNPTTQSGYGTTDTGSSNSGLGTATVFSTTTSHSTQLGSSSSGYPSDTSTTQSSLPDRTLGSNQPTSTGYDSTHTGNTSSGHQLGRDAATIGVTGLAAEGIHHHRDHERGLGDNEYSGTSRSMPLSSNTAHDTTSASNPLGSNTGSGSQTGHHLGRDAAAVGTAGAIGEGIHHHREHERDHGISGATSGSHVIGSTSGPHSTNTANLLDPNVRGGARSAEDAHTHHPHHGGGAEAADMDHSPGGGSNTMSRDVAIGASGLGGAIGVGEYERRHQNVGSSGLGNTSGVNQPLTGSTSSRNDPTSTGTTGKDHHYGRDAAIGVGGVGAAGLAGREYEKHHDSTANPSGTSALNQSTSGSSLPGPAPNTAGPHSKDWMNKLDPRVIANPTVAQGNPQAESALSSQQPSAETGGYGGSNASSGHHYGRDAAVAGGVGAAAYEADKHHSGKHDTHKTTDLSQPGTSAISGNQYPAHDATTGSNVAHQGHHSIADSDRSKDHHYGRDAAVTGGVGAAAYEADKHHKHDKDLTQAEHDAKKQHKHDEKELKKELKKEHKHDEKEAHKKSKGGLLGFLHRDKNKKYTQEEEAEFDRQEREHNSHKGRDAALGAGAVGTAGYAVHEHNKDHAGTSIADKPVGEDLGDKLHGVDRNRGIAGASGIPGSAGYGTGEVAGTSGIAGSGIPGAPGAGSHVHSEASTDQYGNPINTGVPVRTGNDHLTSAHQGQGHHLGRDAALGAGAGGLAAHEHHKHESGHQSGLNTGYDNQRADLTGSHQNQGQHHLGRDAALGAGVGAGGLAAHEHQKHEAGHQSGLNTGYDNQRADLTSSHQNQGQHHLGRDAALVGGAGALGEHEHRKHEGTHQTGSNTLGSTGQYDNTSSSHHQIGSNDIVDPRNDGRIGPNVNEGPDGRNRLHKDPPAGHPASGASHVPGSGSETQRMMYEGKQRIDDDTGVAHSAEGRNNY